MNDVLETIAARRSVRSYAAEPIPAGLLTQSLGLGSCWVHVPAHLDDSPESQELRAELGIPAGHRIHGSIALGYAAGPAPRMPERRPGAFVILD